MTREEILYQLDQIPTIGEQVDALEIAYRLVEIVPDEDLQKAIKINIVKGWK